MSKINVKFVDLLCTQEKFQPMILREKIISGFYLIKKYVLIEKNTLIKTPLI